ncbi:MAG: hypothetical protein Kow00107_03490 [Planctomycetota bacterium]
MDNYANGIQPAELTIEEVQANAASNLAKVERVIEEIINAA